MITYQQVKAARAMLDWKQADLAKASGISLAAIARLEQGTANPRADTLQALQVALETNGIEFNEDLGVSLKREVFKLEAYDGLAGMDRIWEDIIVTLLALKDGELLMGGMDERLWVQYYGDKVGDQMKRRWQLGIKSRLLIRAGDNLCLGDARTYRCVPKELFGHTHYFIYADKFVLITFGAPLKVVLIHNANVADVFRKQFNFHWELGKPVKNPKILFPLE